jgi:hypothetical protein
MDTNLFELSNSSIVRAKSQAGPRYSPGISPEFPSLKIKNLVQNYDGLSRNMEFWNRITELCKDINSIISGNEIIIKQKKLPLKLLQPAKECKWILTRILKRLKEVNKLHKNKFYERNIQKLEIENSKLERFTSEIQETIYREEDNPSLPQNSEWRNEAFVSTLKNETRALISITYELSQFFNSMAVTYCDTPISLLLGKAGTGKTHFLCDLAVSKQREQKLVFIFIANNIQIVKGDPWQTLLNSLQAPCTKKQFITRVKKQASTQNERVLIIIDAINEADKAAWSKLCRILISDIGSIKEIGLIISCRTPFQELYFSKRLLNSLNIVNHYGFHDIEFNAQKEFFKFYKYPEVSIPLLISEFTNPLFLKVFCEALYSVSIKKRHKQITDFPSGQKGMTYILEKFTKAKQKKIYSELKSKYKTSVLTCTNWLWGRGRTVGLVKEIAYQMSSQSKDYITESSLTSLIRKYTTNKKVVKEVKLSLLYEGVIIEGFDWSNNISRKVIRFGYQKFSDHLIARELLKQYNCNKKASAKNIYHAVKNYPNLLEAVMIEFPRRSKRVELLTQIQSRDVTYGDLESFIDGLYWRDNNVISSDTNRIVNWCLSDNNLKDKMYDALVALGMKTKSKYNASTLDKYLQKTELTDRDIHWTEYLRKCTDTSPTLKLVNWIRGNDRIEEMTKPDVKNIILILKWLLTTNRRMLRDEATFALVLLGVHFPHLLFEQTIASLEINDLYVGERMLAASYGLCMRIYNCSKTTNSDKSGVVEFAKVIYKHMFAKNAKHSTTHVLMRDYASSIIKLATRYQSKLLRVNQLNRISAPYRDGGIRKWGKSKNKNSGEYRDGNAPIGMNFRNYTIGKLVDGRDNYDFNNADFKEVESNIYWRLYNLGYSLEKFGELDKSIARESQWSIQYNKGKVDRYGKKYLWIAFYELFGHRQDNRTIEDIENLPRFSGCDIDPSFPGVPHKTPVINRNWLPKTSISISNWIKHATCSGLKSVLRRESIYNLKGPWVLLSCYVKSIDENRQIEHSIWIVSRIFKNKIMRNLDAKQLRLINSQNKMDETSFYYTFAGELSWHSSYTQDEEEYLNIKIGEKIETSDEKSISVYQHGKELRLHKRSNILNQLSNFRDDETKSLQFLKENNIRVKMQVEKRKYSVPIYKRIPVLTPINCFSWESHHSLLNPGQNVSIPSRELIDFSVLKIDIPNWDFIDSKGEKAIINIDSGERFGTRQELVYIREDILDKYLRKSKLKMLWFVNGERQLLHRNAITTNVILEGNIKPYKTYGKVIQY